MVAGHQLTSRPGSDVLLASRPMIEARIRTRVAALPNVEVRDRSRVAELITSRRPDTSSSEWGWTAPASDPGSGLSLIWWLPPVDVPAGFRMAGEPRLPRPPEDRLQVDLAYVSFRIRLRPHRLDGARLVGIWPRPGLPRGLMLIEQEDHWILTGGLRGSPPADG